MAATTRSGWLSSAERIAAGGRSLVFEWTKSLSHVTELAQRGLEFVRPRGPLMFFLRGALATAAHVHDEEQDADDRQGDENWQHGGQRR